MKTTTKIIIGLIIGTWILTLIGFGVKVDKYFFTPDLDSPVKIEYSEDSITIPLKRSNGVSIIVNKAPSSQYLTNKIVITQSCDSAARITMPAMLKDFLSITQNGDTITILSSIPDDMDYYYRNMIDDKNIYINLNDDLKSVYNDSRAPITIYKIATPHLSISGDRDRGWHPSITLHKCDIGHLTLTDFKIHLYNSNVKSYTFPTDSILSIEAKNQPY